MKHICDTIKDYEDAMRTSMQGDIIYCSEALWDQIMNEYQPERTSEEDTEMCMRCSEPSNERDGDRQK